MSATLSSFPHGGIAVVIGATGGIGHAMMDRLGQSTRFSKVVGLSRSGGSPLDLTDETSIEAAAAAASSTGAVRLIVDATGFLHGGGFEPEKSWRHLDAAHLAHAFAVNATGPALIMKHFLPLLPREGKAVFTSLSAKVGSIGDNHIGGWYGYRASKAALNQLVHTAAIELKRTHPDAVCVTVHPGTVDTPLSRPFAKTGLTVQDAEDAAARVVVCLDDLTADDSGGFFDRGGERLPW